MGWYITIGPQKPLSWDDIRKEFLRQYSYNVDLPITLRDL